MLLTRFVTDDDRQVANTTAQQIQHRNSRQTKIITMAANTGMDREPFDVMDPKPGERYVEYSKDGSDGDTKRVDESGLDVEHKKNHGEERIYLSKVQHPAPGHNLKVGDRLVALNGKKIEEYSSLQAIREEIHNHNVVRLVVDPTLL